MALAPACLAGPAPSYYDLMHQAQATAPRILESRANVGMAQGRADQSGVFPNPTGGILFENFGGGGVAPALASNYTSQEQTTLSVSELIELGGKRDARMAVGAADLGVAQARDRQALADFSYELALAYAGAEAAQARVKLNETAVQAAGEDLRGAVALVDAGREAGVRAKQANAAMMAAQAELEAARADAATVLARLSMLVAASQTFTDVMPSLLPLAENLPTTAPPEPAKFLTVVAAEAERDASVSRMDLERARAIPDVTATLGVRRLTGYQQTVLMGGISLPIPLFDQNSGNISAAGSQVVAASARLAAARSEAETGWRAALAQANATVARLSAAHGAADAAEEAYGLTRTGYESGKTSLAELLASRRALTDAQLLLLNARVARIGASAALARLAGNIAFGEGP